MDEENTAAAAAEEVLSAEASSSGDYSPLKAPDTDSSKGEETDPSLASPFSSPEEDSSGDNAEPRTNGDTALPSPPSPSSLSHSSSTTTATPSTLSQSSTSPAEAAAFFADPPPTNTTPCGFVDTATSSPLPEDDDAIHTKASSFDNNDVGELVEEELEDAVIPEPPPTAQQTQQMLGIVATEEQVEDGVGSSESDLLTNTTTTKMAVADDVQNALNPISEQSQPLEASPEASPPLTPPPRQQPQQQQQVYQTPPPPQQTNYDNNNSDNDDDDDDDVARKAAVTLAAVAAAASSKHKSPAEAAREARAVAQSFLKQASDGNNANKDHNDKGAAVNNSNNNVSGGKGQHHQHQQQQQAHPPPPPRKQPTLHVRWSVLQSVLLEQQQQQAAVHSTASTSSSSTSFKILSRLVAGENVALLQYLLLLENIECEDDDDDDDEDYDDYADASVNVPAGTGEGGEGVESNLVDSNSIDEFSHTEEKRIGQQACLRILNLLKKLEAAYDSLLDMLGPASKNASTTNASQNMFDEEEEEDFETPVVVPDLLPPCTSAAGDATLAFFRACVGHEGNTGGERSPSGSVHTADTASVESLEHPSSSTTTPAPPPPNETPPSPVRHGSFLGGLLKRHTTPQQQQHHHHHHHAHATNKGVSAASSLTSVFRKKSYRNARSLDNADAGASSLRSAEDDSQLQYNNNSGEYPVKIEREMLGLTVENVLERTVVRTVLPGGPAKKAGAKVGSLIVQVANVSTRNLTHFETIDELRQSQRPLILIMKQVSDDSLRAAREEMGRLIRGSGFGTIMDGLQMNSSISTAPHHHGHGPNRPFRHAQGDDDTSGGMTSASNTTDEEGEGGRPIIGADLRIEAFTTLLRRRLSEATVSAPNASTTTGNKKNAAKNKHQDDVLARMSDKLVWILTLFTVGLEREAARLFSLLAASGVVDDPSSSPRRQRHSLYSHTAHDYNDAAKSVSKVLLDYTRKKVDPHQLGGTNAQHGGSNSKSRAAGFLQHSLEAVGGMRRRGGGAPPPAAPMTGRGGRNSGDTSTPHEKPLLQIGDVLQRTRTFLADTTSPPAALLRGELIAFLCDVLDIDTEMELAEEESDSAMAGGSGAKAGMINDLGSAGSLLKLIVLNCPIMRSPGCEDASARQESLDPDIELELKRRFGPRDEKFTTSDLHRLHAGNRFLSVVHRLAASRSTSARITACSLGPVLWGHLDFPHQLQLRGVITRALHDVEVIVRKSTATVLHEIAELVFDRRSVPWLVLMCERAMTDPEPQLRSAAMTLTWHLAEHLPNAFLGNASQGSRYLRRLPSRDDPIFADVYLLQCKLLPVATRLAEDRSPSVRLAVAAQCDRLCDALGDHWSSVIIDVLLALLSDSDDRVRCEAVSCVPRLAEIVLLSVSPGEVAVSEVSILEALVPASMKLQKDPSSSVRIALATAAGELLALLVALQRRADEAVPIGDPTSPERSEISDGNKKYKRQVDDRLIPLVQNLLNDKDPEVTSAALRAVTNATRSSVQQSRQRLMSVASTEDDSVSLSSYHSYASDKKAPVLTPVLSEKQVLRLLPTLTELAGSRQWRVRQSAVEIVPALLGCTQKLETRSEISKLCISLMGDRVDAVRKTAAECLCMGASSLGSHGEDASSDWIGSIVIPSIRRCAIHSDSKQRLLSLKMVEVILLNGACPSKWKSDSVDEDRIADTPMRELAVIALSLTSDRIANVRLNVGRILESVIHVFEEDDLGFMIEVLLQQIQAESEREGGGDRDVLFFAQRCVNRAKSVLEDRLVTDESSQNTDD